MRRTLLSISCLVVVALAGCHGDTALPQATGKGTVRAINAISTAPEINFLIEERLSDNLGYAVASNPTQYDDLSYVFNFETVLAGDSTRTRVASQALDVVKDTDYTFLIMGQLANPTISLWERPRPDIAAGATDFEAQVGNASAALGDIDVYLADPATAPALGNELGTLSPGEVLPISTLPAGDYVLTLTASGDPATVRYQSDTVTFTGAEAVLITAFDQDGASTAPTVVHMTNLNAATSTRLPDANYPATMRFIHTALTLAAADIYIDDPLTTPILANHAFGEVSADLDTPAGVLPLTYTTAGNIGSIVVDTETTVAPGLRHHVMLLENSAGEGDALAFFPNRRSVETQARIGVANTSTTHTPVDVYIIPTGETLDNASPVLNGLNRGFAPVTVPLTAGDFDLYVTADDDQVPLAGPIALGTSLGDVFDIIILENVDPAFVDVAVIALP